MPSTKDDTHDVWVDRAVKLGILTLVFPILALAIHEVFIVPVIVFGALLIHFGLQPEFWGKVLSAVALIPACWGAGVVCKWIWPRG